MSRQRTHYGGVVCPRCRGLGFTTWDAFVSGLASLIGSIFGRSVEAVCKRCKGVGSVSR